MESIENRSYRDPVETRILATLLASHENKLKELIGETTEVEVVDFFFPGNFFGD